MGLFDFFSKPKNKKVDIDGKEVVDFTDLTVPVPVVHSNTIEGGHDVFAKAMIDEPIVIETEKEAIEDIPSVEEEVQDLSSINMGSSEEVQPVQEVQPEEVKEETVAPQVEVDEKEMALFKACLLAEVKRKKGTGSLNTDEDVKNFCQERMVAYKEGTFDYPEEIKKSMKKMMDAQNMIQGMMPKKEENEGVKKIA